MAEEETRTIGFWTNKAQRDYIKDMARSLGLTQSQFLRFSAFSATRESITRYMLSGARLPEQQLTQDVG